MGSSFPDQSNPASLRKIRRPEIPQDASGQPQFYFRPDTNNGGLGGENVIADGSQWVASQKMNPGVWRVVPMTTGVYVKYSETNTDSSGLSSGAWIPADTVEYFAVEYPGYLLIRSEDSPGPTVNIVRMR